jgi:hypothetical protein
MNKPLRFLVYPFLFACCLSACTAAKENRKEAATKKYEPVSLALYDTIMRMDSMLFDAFNNHDLVKMQPLFSRDVEFYHDKGGLTNYHQTMENFQGLFDRNKTTGLKRTLVPGSIEVYPIKNYGAVQTGMHRFCHVENGKDDCGTFKFVHLWQRKDDIWQLTRLISYDH